MSIEQTRDGYILVDRGSACGTKLAGESIGGKDSDGKTTIIDGDTFALGTASTPYLYRFIVLEK